MLHPDTTCCDIPFAYLPAVPQPLLWFDAWQHDGKIVTGASISTWNNSGSAPLIMNGLGINGLPRLQYESGVPYVEFNRTSLSQIAYFQSDRPLTVPLPPSNVGLTMAAVFRMWPTQDGGNVQGGIWEKLLACGVGGGDDVIVLGRYTTSAMMDFEWQNGASGLNIAWRAGTITGQWQTIVFRLRNSPLAVSYYDGQWQTTVNRAADPSPPILLPRTVVSNACIASQLGLVILVSSTQAGRHSLCAFCMCMQCSEVSVHSCIIHPSITIPSHHNALTVLREGANTCKMLHKCIQLQPLWSTNASRVHQCIPERCIFYFLMVDLTLCGLIPCCCYALQPKCLIGSSFWPEWADPYLAGGIRELRMYNSALSDGEVLALYDEMVARWQTPPPLPRKLASSQAATDNCKPQSHLPFVPGCCSFSCGCCSFSLTSLICTAAACLNQLPSSFT